MAIEIDPLDLVISMVRPPANFFEEVEAYWSYLECPCGAWLWRRHLGDPTWGVRCYSCNAPWRDTYLQHGFSHWNPVAKRRTLPGDGVDTARWLLAKRQCHLSRSCRRWKPMALQKGWSHWSCKRAEDKGLNTWPYTWRRHPWRKKKGVWCCRLLLLFGAWQMQWCLQHVLNLNPFAAVMLNPSSFKTSPLGRLVLQKGYL